MQVALKIIKHCEEESDDGIDLVQGVLLGLVVDKKLEITNCFPIPRMSTDDDVDNREYTSTMVSIRIMAAITKFYTSCKYITVRTPAALEVVLL